jgi:acyl-CoA thioesterase-2
VATYTSDHSLLGAIRRPHGGGMGLHGDFMSASLDHALWFHRHFRMDQWLLYDQVSPVSAHARGLAMGHFYTQQGELVASVCQEGLLRPVDPGKNRGKRASTP